MDVVLRLDDTHTQLAWDLVEYHNLRDSEEPLTLAEYLEELLGRTIQSEHEHIKRKRNAQNENKLDT